MVLQDEHISFDAYQWRMRSMDIQAESGVFLKGKLVEENVWPCADRDRQDSMGYVWSGAECSPNSVQRKIKVAERDGR